LKIRHSHKSRYTKSEKLSDANHRITQTQQGMQWWLNHSKRDALIQRFPTWQELQEQCLITTVQNVQQLTPRLPVTMSQP